MNKKSIPLMLALIFWTSGAHAVCFKGDVSVDPTKGPVAPWNVEFRQSQAVVIGTAVSEKSIPDPANLGLWSGTVYTLKVDSTLKGSLGRPVEVFSENSSGRFPLKVRSRYLLFLRYDSKTRYWIADPCGNSAKLVYPF